MTNKNGKILLILNENFQRVPLSPDKIYFISHPCTNGNGGEKYNREKEAEIYDLLCSENKDFKAIRPLKIIPNKYDYDKAMGVCYSLIDVCDCVIFSPNWQLSKGCKLEHKYCIENDIPRLYIVEEDISKISP